MNLADLRLALTTASVEELPDIIAQLEACKALAWIRLVAATASTQGQDASRNQTAGQISAALGVPESAVYDWARKGRIPSERYGRFVRFSLAEVRTALNSKRPEHVTSRKSRKDGHFSGPPTAGLPGQPADSNNAANYPRGAL